MKERIQNSSATREASVVVLGWLLDRGSRRREQGQGPIVSFWRRAGVSAQASSKAKTPARSTLNRYKHRSDGIFTSRQPIAQENLRMLRGSKTLTWLSRLHCLFATSLEGLQLTTPSLVRPLRLHHDHLGRPPSVWDGMVSIIHVAIKQLQCLS